MHFGIFLGFSNFGSYSSLQYLAYHLSFSKELKIYGMIYLSQQYREQELYGLKPSNIWVIEEISLALKWQTNSFIWDKMPQSILIVKLEETSKKTTENKLNKFLNNLILNQWQVDQ